MPSPIAAVFDNTLQGSHEGEGWRVSSVSRDVATVRHITTGAFACSTQGMTGTDGRGFSNHVIFLRAGKLNVDQYSHQRRLLAGDIFVACGWQPLALAASGRLDLLVISLPGWWSMQRIMDTLQILPDLYISKDYFASPLIADLAQLVFDLPEGDAPAAAQALTMLADLLRTALAAGAKAETTLPRVRGRMGEILWFIARNIEQRGLSAQDAAAALKCSVRTIYKTCAMHGTSFSALLTETRLVAAQYQLIQTRERVSQVAYEVGFASLSHFSRLFRARFGVTAKAMSAANRAEVMPGRQG